MKSPLIFLMSILTLSCFLKANDINISIVNARDIILPQPVTPPQIHYVFKNNDRNQSEKKLHFPPNYLQTKNDIFMAEEDRAAGDIRDGKVSLYLATPYTGLETFLEHLHKEGFIDLALSRSKGDTHFLSVLFTSKELIEQSAIHSKGFNAVLYAFIDLKNKMIFILNPRYQLKYMLQDIYNERLALSILEKLRSSFPLHDTDKKLKFLQIDNLSRPLYISTKIIAKGESNRYFLGSLKRSAKVIFSIELPNESFLVGLNFISQTLAFNTTEGSIQPILPCIVLLEDEQVQVLKSQFYSNFFGVKSYIVNEECSKIFK